MKGRVFVDRFDSAEHLTGKKRTYAAVKAAVLEAGRFSIFEATANGKSAAIFNDIERDPELVCDREKYGYPWIAVSRREAK